MQPSVDLAEIARGFVAALRAVKLYPPNNPIYNQTLQRASGLLAGYVGLHGPLDLVVQRSGLLIGGTAVGGDSPLNRAAAQDLFQKGIRHIRITPGLQDREVGLLYQLLALPPETVASEGGLKAMLWEREITHIEITESELDGVVTSKGRPGPESILPRDSAGPAAGQSTDTFPVGGVVVAVNDLLTDPAAFGAMIHDLVQKTSVAGQSVPDRVYSLYREAGAHALTAATEASEPMFRALARSLLSLPQQVRDSVIGGRLYAALDAEAARSTEFGATQHVPSELHEIMTGRFSRAWTEQEVGALLRKTASKPEPPEKPRAPKLEPVPTDYASLAQELAQYSPAELEELQSLGNVGGESDVVDASVKTLTALLPLALAAHAGEPSERALSLFSALLHELDGLLAQLLAKKEYALAALVVRAYQGRGEPSAVRRQLAASLKNAATRPIIVDLVADLHGFPKSSPRHQAAYAYISALEGTATPVLLEVLAEEEDRSVRRMLVDLLKEFGKKQIALLGERLSDERWYFVRNIVGILGESRTDEAVAYLEKVLTHKNFQIRQEVARSLMTIGGRKAAALLSRLLDDRDIDIQFMAIRGLGALTGGGTAEAEALTAFISRHAWKKQRADLVAEAMRSLAKLGDQRALEFLQDFRRPRWWRPGKLQREHRAAAGAACDELTRRLARHAAT